MVEDIRPELDTISWTVLEPCGIGTGVNDGIQVADELRVFPNPARDRIQVTGVSSMDELILCDAQGVVLRRWAPPFQQVVDLPAVPDGLYLLRATSDAGVRSTKVVVQR